VKLLESTWLLRAFAWARLAVTALLAVSIPLTTSEVSAAHTRLLELVLLVATGSSLAVLARRAVPHPRRIAGLLSTLDIALVTAVVAATGGARSVYSFLYVLSVTSACALLARPAALAISAAACLFYSGLVFGATVIPVAYLFEPPHETTALEVVTIFLNSATFLVVAIVVGGLAERYRATQEELQTRQRALRDLEAFRDLVFDCVGTGLIVLDRGHRVTVVNRAATEITGRDAAALMGASWGKLAGDGIDLDEVATALEASPTASVRHETTLQRRGGETIPVRVTFSSLRSAAGTPLGLVAACDDLSTIRRMEARMRHADRLATLGRMSANIAHEIRNPLASMTGAIEALTGPSSIDADERESLRQIVAHESERLNRIVRDFLAYARPTPLQRTRTDIAGLLEDVLVLLEHRPLPDGVKLVRAFTAPVWAEVDPNALRQSLWNLCLNALEAMPDGGELTVGASNGHAAVEMWVADTGRGIEPGELPHIFEPFYSTKREGSGLGLALVHRVVADHAGDVDVRSVPGTGTTFTLTLPVAVHG
jgi:two-component system sensor histidine kinase PilS (NtrC family)